ncbi:gliding motility-associated C-terminal domain-containing protein [Flavobacterium sp. 7A]|uniref:gliding motility-associated C-terminal domain-containing protein n=1 Tax=Flavobacterium sp. 7A TaxID=2940571 RepID=UPI002226B1D1|nr:gliding motility-associated C-terminal domain-containing protein [Flavobacterium sp. 7A]MCW2119851.1 gliding motility-associated-like protein [Flavobacterium sp. 7A]
MKKLLFLFLLIVTLLNVNAQSAFYNNGNVQIHENGQVGFHTNLINDGVFDKNEGLVGFYSIKDYLVVAGKNEAIFKNIEIDVFDNLYLNTSIGLTNDLLFISGKVVTPRDDITVSLDFLKHQLYVGEGNATHVDGYAKVINEGEFVFPIGDDHSFRPMILQNQEKNSIYKGAYFREDPSSPSTFSPGFSTSKMQNVLKSINTVEFWDLDGAIETSIKLTWDRDSDLKAFAENMQSLRVVGWSKELNVWVELGNKITTGSLDEGTIESNVFLPDNFEAITIGSIADINNVVNRNYGISPNGDGVNDTFVIEGISLSSNNTLSIYNRWGVLVYSKNGYDNSWGGISQNKLTINASQGLPEGTYFYVIEFHDKGKSWQGYVYIKRK